MIKLTVDYENNSELFWTAFHKAFPQFQGAEEFCVTQEEFQQIQGLPGWTDPEDPYYGSHPLLAEYEGKIAVEVKKIMAEREDWSTYEFEAREYPNGLYEVSFASDQEPSWFLGLGEVMEATGDPILDCRTVRLSEVSLQEIANSINSSQRAYGEYPSLQKARELLQ